MPKLKLISFTVKEQPSTDVHAEVAGKLRQTLEGLGPDATIVSISHTTSDYIIVDKATLNYTKWAVLGTHVVYTGGIDD